jgi:hypothetical protein
MRIRIAVAGLAVALVPLAACDDQHQQTETRSYDVPDSAGTVNAVAVNSLGGRITVIAGSGTTIHVTETLRYAGARPEPQHKADGSDLSFTSGCQGHQGSCGVDYRLEVPASPKSTLDSAGGAISLTGMSGELNLTSGGGAIDATGITTPTVTAHTKGGAVTLTFTKSPTTVRVDSGGGDATLRLPRDRYTVDAKGGGGTTTVQVPDAPASGHELSVDSGGGAILITTTETP